jgi:uncharacterized protein (DUF302 family)
MYAFSVELDLPVDAAIEKLTAALAQEKMGVISDINVAAIMKAKLDHDMPPYRILGACAPGLAKRVIEAQADVGAMLPCGVAVYQVAPGRTRLAFQDPDAIASVVSDPVIAEVAREARAKLLRVRDALA